MSVLEKIHASQIQERRVKVLCQELAKLFPLNATILDVGSGDGWLAHLIQQTRPDLKIHGVDVLLRERTHIPVAQFDGKTIPSADKSFDYVMFVDVLHHTEDPMILLREAFRVARQGAVIKDHTCDGILAFKTLKFMDDVGNKRYGVALPNNYWPEAKWRESFDSLGVIPTVWQRKVGLYPWPLNWFFERQLHFIGKFEFQAASARSADTMIQRAEK